MIHISSDLIKCVKFEFTSKNALALKKMIDNCIIYCIIIIVRREYSIHSKNTFDYLIYFIIC